MSSVLEKKFQVEFNIPHKSSYPVQNYLEKNVGPRTYYLHSQLGGKNWAIKNSFTNKVVVCVNDPELATFITLKYT